MENEKMNYLRKDLQHLCLLSVDNINRYVERDNNYV